MPIRRIIVAMGGVRQADEAFQAALGALSAAAAQKGLRFAFPRRMEARVAELCGQTASPLVPEVVFYTEPDDLMGLSALVTEESHFLYLTGEYGFAPKWDQVLFHRLAQVPEKNAVLTGCISAADGEYPPQAYLPALSDGFADGGALLGRGLPLVNGAAPVRTLLVYPALLFGRTGFLQTVSLKEETLSLAAYVAGVPVYALDRAALWPLHPPGAFRLTRPVRDALPGTTLARFEQLAGLRYEERSVTFRARQGLFTAENGYAQRLPRELLPRQGVQALVHRLRPATLPMVVTAFIDLPEPRKPVPLYMLRFAFLKALQALPLTLFTGGAQERALRAGLPNARSYPDNALLPRQYLAQGMTAEQWMQRNKLLLLAKAAREWPEMTHVTWVNIDTLKHPLCPDALPDFAPLMDDRVHLATVNAIPDTSFVMVPVRALRYLTREIQELTQMDVEWKRDLTEVSLVQRLYHQRPELFALHPMPKKHLLFLTAFDPSLLDTRTQRLLSDLPPVSKAEAGKACPKPSRPGRPFPAAQSRRDLTK